MPDLATWESYGKASPRNGPGGFATLVSEVNQVHQGKGDNQNDHGFELLHEMCWRASESDVKLMRRSTKHFGSYIHERNALAKNHDDVSGWRPQSNTTALLLLT